MNKKNIGLILLIIGVVLFGYAGFLFRASAHDGNYCEGKGCKISVTPTPPCGKPTGIIILTAVVNNCVTPTIEPSAIPTETPIPTGSPSATPTPTSTPQTGNSSGGNGGGSSLPGSTTNAPGAATCNIPFSAPVLTSITAGRSGELNVNWLESDQNIDKFSIIFGKVGQPLNMGVPSIPGNSRSYTIQGLHSGDSINAEVWSWKGGCAEKSNELDPKVF